MAGSGARRIRSVLFQGRHAALNLDRLRHAVQEQQGTDPEADHDPLRQVAEHDQQERRHQHHGIPARGAQQRRELVLFRHVPGDHGQHGGQRR